MERAKASCEVFAMYPQGSALAQIRAYMKCLEMSTHVLHAQ